MPVRSRLALVLTLAACSSSAPKSAPAPPIPPTSPAPSTTATSTTPTTLRRGSSTSTTRPASPPNLGAVHIALTRVVAGLDSPIAVAWRVHDPNMFVAEQPGRVRIVTPDGQLSSTPVLTISPLSHGNEEGLLGITFSPDGTKLYVDYTDPSNNTQRRRVHDARRAGRARVTRRQLLVVQQPYSNHNGGEVVIGPDGMLYIGLGDGGSEDDPNHNGQNLGDAALEDPAHQSRRRADPRPTRVPADNPFVGRAGARPETWMWGLRNPWRFSFDAQDGRRVDRRRRPGQVRRDRLRAARAEGHQLGLERAGGFPRVPGRGSERRARPASSRRRTPTGSCAIVGGYVYRGTAIPALDGVYIFGDDCRPNLDGRRAATNGRVIAQRDSGPSVSQLTTFGEDLTASSTRSRGGTIYKITAG